MPSFLTEIRGFFKEIGEPKRQAQELNKITKSSFAPKTPPPSVTSGISPQHRAETESTLGRWKGNREQNSA